MAGLDDPLSRDGSWGNAPYVPPAPFSDGQSPYSSPAAGRAADTLTYDDFSDVVPGGLQLIYDTFSDRVPASQQAQSSYGRSFVTGPGSQGKGDAPHVPPAPFIDGQPLYSPPVTPSTGQAADALDYDDFSDVVPGGLQRAYDAFSDRAATAQQSWSSYDTAVSGSNAPLVTDQQQSASPSFTTLAGKALSFLNPIGSAQAAEPGKPLNLEHVDPERATPDGAGHPTPLAGYPIEVDIHDPDRFQRAVDILSGAYKPGKIESAIRGENHGASFGLAPRFRATAAASGMSSLFPLSGPFGAARMEAEAIAPSIFGHSATDRYNQVRSMEEAADALAARENPGTYTSAAIAGGLGTTLLIPESAIGRVASAGKTVATRAWQVGRELFAGGKAAEQAGSIARPLLREGEELLGGEAATSEAAGAANPPVPRSETPADPLAIPRAIASTAEKIAQTQFQGSGRPPQDTQKPAKDVASVLARLQVHLESAVAKFEEEGYTYKQRDSLKIEPWRAAQFRGTRIHTFFNKLVEDDPNVNWLEITPLFNEGPDLIDRENKIWYDVTTYGQWDRNEHVRRYTQGYGQGYPLLYK
ncbi:hypothetical protein SAMN05519104_1670 [Rhizobiales bacterium GAS188]|nr:hypothetical protein SAMN05519104_1670 [Rhizobiales bacterium GAS188]